MLKCPACDAYNPAGSTSCAACDAPMPGAEEEADPRAAPAQRPTGSLLMVLGWIAVAAAGGLSILGLSARTPSAMGEPAFNATAGSSLFLGLAGDALWAGFFLLLAGSVVRAIWFLPGDETRKRTP